MQTISMIRGDDDEEELSPTNAELIRKDSGIEECLLVELQCTELEVDDQTRSIGGQTLAMTKQCNSTLIAIVSPTFTFERFSSMYFSILSRPLVG